MATTRSISYAALPARGLIARLVGCLVGVILIAAVPAACSRESPSPGAAKPILRVVATTGMIADAARAIAGTDIEVAALMGEGVDPHLYKPAPGDVRLLESADVILFNGLHLEGKLIETLESLAKRKRVAPLGDALPADSLRRDDGGHADPHIWFDPVLWAHAADRVAEVLAAADPARADGYRARAATYHTELLSLDREARERLAVIPADRRVLVTAHDAFGYFGRAYGIEVLGIQGISTESEAGLKDINALVDLLVQRKIPAVFVESSVPRKTIEALIEGAQSRGHKIRIGGELFSDAMGAAGTPEGTYVGMFRHNVSVIAAALAGDAAADAREKVPEGGS